MLKCSDLQIKQDSNEPKDALFGKYMLKLQGFKVKLVDDLKLAQTLTLRWCIFSKLVRRTHCADFGVLCIQVGVVIRCGILDYPNWPL